MKLVLIFAAVALQASTVYGQWGRRRSPPSPSPWGRRRSWPPSPSQPPNKTVTVYHLFQPKFTGLANKDAGDFLGDASFIFMTFNSFEAGNPEADIQDNIIEMSTVTVEDWSTDYLKCNAPGAVYNGSRGQQLDCPSTSTDYCCIDERDEPAQPTSDTLPAYEDRSRHGGGGGYWFSFPKASEGKKWTEKMERRINGSCIANAWRQEAGGCSQCGANLDQCVAGCIQAALVSGSRYQRDYSKLKPAWDRSFSNKTLCPDQPFPEAEAATVIV